MKKTLLVLLSLLPLLAAAQKIKIKQLTPKKIPSEVDYLGDVVQAIQWKDNAGENITVFTETAKAQNKDRPEKDLFEASIDARHFVLIEDHWRQKWSMHDQVHECGLELAATYVGDAEVTDLDADGINEVWMVYRIGCHNIGRPSYMKVVMYEGEARYSIKGLSDATIGERRGDYTFDANLTKASTEFKEYATELWNYNVTNERRLYRPGQTRY